MCVLSAQKYVSSAALGNAARDVEARQPNQSRNMRRLHRPKCWRNAGDRRRPACGKQSSKESVQCVGHRLIRQYLRIYNLIAYRGRQQLLL